MLMHNRRLLAALIGFALAPVSMAAKQPDLSGVWETYQVSHAPAKTPQDVFVDEQALIGGEPKLREPYASDYAALQKKKQAAEAAGQPIIDGRTQCLPEGMPEMMMAILPIEILQTDKEMVVLTELFAQTRRIYLNRKMPLLDELIPGYFGYSVGHWQGTTLIVETQGIRDETQFLDMPHSPQMKITEQFKLVDANVLEDHIVIDDPEVRQIKSKLLQLKRVSLCVCMCVCKDQFVSAATIASKAAKASKGSISALPAGFD
jgi:hypothetical protein